MFTKDIRRKTDVHVQIMEEIMARRGRPEPLRICSASGADLFDCDFVSFVLQPGPANQIFECIEFRNSGGGERGPWSELKQRQVVR